MKIKFIKSGYITIFLFVIFASLSQLTNAQTDSTKVTQTDPASKQTTKEEGKKKKKKDEVIVYAGGNASELNTTSSQLESNYGLGYQLGIAYKRGRYFYWQAGAKYTLSQYNLKNTTSGIKDDLAVSSFDVPLTAGVNFLAFVNKLVALRLFVSAVPSFTLGVKDNDLGIKKENVSSFMFYGQGGLGVNVAFFVIETGFNYGLQSTFINDKESRPGQFFVNLGFRF